MRNKRWKWMAGATAATAAGVTASQAATITINLVNNYISGSGGNHLNADLTGDGHPDLTIANAVHSKRGPYGSLTSNGQVIYVYYRFGAFVNLNGVRADAIYDPSSRFGSGRLGSQTFYGYGHVTGSIPLFFKDLHINGGAPTEGSLEVTVADRNSNGGAVVQLDSFTYNTPIQGSNLALGVPDQGSTLAL